MQRQRSFNSREGAGCLYLVATPIGNLEDITLRALHILKEADIIACEDTRVTSKLLNHFEITTHLISYHEHNKEKRGAELLEKLQQGKTIALVSDAGLPLVSDPGFELVEVAREEGIPIIPLPGANAALTALIASGLPNSSFTFQGFLPRQKQQLEKALQQLVFREETIILYEAPHRLKKLLEAIVEIFGSERPMVLARELTKLHEEFLRGTAGELFEWASNEQPRGEFVVLIQGGATESPTDLWWSHLTIIEHIEHYMAQGLSSKEAIKQVAVERKVPKREVYTVYHREDQDM